MILTCLEFVGFFFLFFCFLFVFTASGKEGDHVIKAQVREQRFAFGFWGRVERGSWEK